MKTQNVSLEVSEVIGKVSAEYIIPPKPKCIITLAHGAGADMNHVFMLQLANALAETGIATLRFNFPFMENKRGRPDVPAVAHQTIAAAIVQAKHAFPKLPLFVSGKSFGGRMSSQFLSAHPGSKVRGIIFYGFPLHPAGKPSTDRAVHLKDIHIPTLFLQGTRDALATLNLIEEVCASLPTATLVKIDGSDHSFKAGKRDVVNELLTATDGWIKEIIQL